MLFPLAFALNTTIAVSAPQENARSPDIAFKGNGPSHMAWISQAGNSNWSLVYSNDWLGGWSEGRRIAGADASASPPRIFADETGGLSIVFSDAWGIHCIHSPDSGSSWGQPMPISMESREFDAVQGIGGRVGVVWATSGNTQMSELTGCMKQSAYVFLTIGGSPATPRIAANPNGGYGIAWLDNTTKEIMFAGSNSALARTASNTIGNSCDPQIAYDSAGTAHIVWRDAGTGSGAQAGEWDIWHAKYSNNAMSASKPVARTAGFPSEQPKIAVSPQDIPYVLWVDHAPGGPSLVYSRSLDGGATWAQLAQVSRGTGIPENPLILADGNGRLHIFWESADATRSLWHAGWNWTEWTAARRVSPDSAGPFAYRATLDQLNRVHIAFSTEGAAYASFISGFGRSVATQLSLSVPQSACAGEPFTAMVADESEMLVANAEVSLSFYNSSSFSWEEVSSGTTGFDGAIKLSAMWEGRHRVSAERQGHIGAVKYLESAQCAGPAPTPSPSQEQTPSPTPDETPVPTPEPAESPTPLQSPTPYPAPPPSACPLGLLIFFPAILLLRK